MSFGHLYKGDRLLYIYLLGSRDCISALFVMYMLSIVNTCIWILLTLLESSIRLSLTA